MKSHNYVVRLTAIALFAAIIMLTTLIHLPVGTAGGYIHPGDSMIYACAWMLGPIAAVAAAIGSGFADIILGAAIYIPATIVIKALMGLIAGFMLQKLPKKFYARLITMIVASLVMAIGYFVFEYFALGSVAAFAGIPFNLIQAVGGVVIGVIVIEALRKINGINNITNKMRGDK